MKAKNIISFSAALILTASFAAGASAQELIAGGIPLGIRMSLDGVMVEDTCRVGESSPAGEAGILKGDIIIRIGAEDISDAEDVSEAAGALGAEPVTVTVLRDGKARQLNVTPAADSDGSYRLGVLLRDGVSGIGTLTFYDPQSGIYGALGHSISDGASGEALPLGSGEVYAAEISGAARGEAGAPGALEGAAVAGDVLGDIRINCGCGIFGEGDFDGEPIETGDIREGDAEILSTVCGSEPESYRAEISRVFRSGGMTCAVITVTDSALLELTGGIVQGMSGSPIIQDGRLVGAVTHVFVNDPCSGYALGICDMLSAAADCDTAA